MNSPKKSIWSALMQDRLAFLGSVIIVLSTIIAVGGAYIRPDSSKFSNDQNLAIARQSPGFKADFMVIPKAGTSEKNRLFEGLFFGGLEPSEDHFLYDSIAVSEESVKLFWLGLLNAEVDRGKVSEIWDVVKDEGLHKALIANTEQRTYVLGTDSFGRDMLSRLMAGTLVSLSVGFISVLISLVIGITLGAFAGYYRGWVDSVIMWFINVIWSIPTLLMVIAITLVMGKGFVQVFIAVGLTMWVEVARIVRGQFISMRELAFIEAGRSMGYSATRIIFKHMLPNAMGPVIVISAANFAAAILIEAGLSFLGIGTQIPMPSWGTMIKEHYAYITTDMAYLAVLPGLCITILVLAFMLIGNRLRDVLDVKSN